MRRLASSPPAEYNSARPTSTKLRCFVKDGLESVRPSDLAIAWLLALLLAVGKLLAVIAIYQAGER